MKRRTKDSKLENTGEGEFTVESPLEEMPEKSLGDGGGEKEEKLEIEKKDFTIDELKKILEEKKKECEEIYDRLLRTTADFENFKKRAEREKLDYIKFANEDLLRELLLVVDNLERALVSSKDVKDNEAITKGIEMVVEQFFKILKKFGVTSFTSLGEKFDPSRHEAVEQVESTEHEVNTVIGELQKGYFLNDRLLRPALVTVTRYPDETISSD